ncbi:MAG: hypothetical protein JNJ54_25260 [Myxococcaceae bacterium]|nr:hypothetical protein [Myxococcaceae bacterium]
MNWQNLYDSGWHHPGVAWLGVAASVAVLLRTPASSLRTVLLGLSALTAADALFTGALSPLPKDSWLVTPVSIFFVIAGDLRLLVLVERFSAGHSSWRRALLVAVPLAFVVPLLQGVSTRVWPDAFAEQRRIFLVYEVLMVVLLGALLALRQPLARHPPAGRLLVLFLVQYVLWASCDVLLLSGSAWALGLRLLPNALYYGVFPLAAAWWLRTDAPVTDVASVSPEPAA